MYRTAGLVLAGLGLLACQTGGELGSTNPGWEYNDDPFSMDAPMESSGSVGDYADADGDGVTDEDTGSAMTSPEVVLVDTRCDQQGDIEDSFDVSAVTDGVEVVHGGLVTHCDALWFVGLSLDGTSATLSYGDNSGITPTEDSCWCAWTVQTQILGINAGDWTISALGSTADITLE